MHGRFDCKLRALRRKQGGPLSLSKAVTADPVRSSENGSQTTGTHDPKENSGAFETMV